MFLQVGIAESAMNGGGNPNVRKIEIVITPTDKMNTYKADMCSKKKNGEL
jgi:hypothetical protein